jgi:hypothetical protein
MAEVTAGRLVEEGVGVETEPEAVAALAGRAVAELEGAAAAVDADGRGADEAGVVVDVPAGRTVEEKMPDEEVDAGEFADLAGFMESEASFFGWDV